MAGPRVCAIHQPNLFPRWVTLAKLLAADTWVVLDDVQFCRHDHQHRARLGLPDEDRAQWLVLPVHLPRGRATTIREVRLADPQIAQRRVANLTRQYYRRTPGWSDIEDAVDAVADAVTAVGDREGLVGVAELSTVLLLSACGWRGEVVRSSTLGRRTSISTHRSGRLADLTRAAGAEVYLCGRSGRRYLDPRPFARAGTAMTFFTMPDEQQGPLVDLTALATLALRPGVAQRLAAR